MARAIHTMLRVLDLDRSLAFYKRAFGLELADRFDFDGFTLAYLRNDEADFEVELTQNHGRSEPYAPGDGYGHLAFSVDDLAALHDRLTAEGASLTPIRELAHAGRPLARFFFVTDPDGYKIEILQRGGRYH
jgi:lactoylglutathione lyase